MPKIQVMTVCATLMTPTSSTSTAITSYDLATTLSSAALPTPSEPSPAFITTKQQVTPTTRPNTNVLRAAGTTSSMYNSRSAAVSNFRSVVCPVIDSAT